MAKVEKEGSSEFVLDLESLRPLGETRLSSLLQSLKQSTVTDTLSLAEFIELLGLKSPANKELSSNIFGNLSQEEFPPVKSDLLGLVELAKREGLIRDFIGIGRKVKNTRIIFSSVVGRKPKPHLAMYLLFINRLKRELSDFEFIVHLEDWFMSNFLPRSVDLDSKSKYMEYIKRFCGADVIITTSSITTKAIPQRFIQDSLSQVTLEDFISVLPFTKHSLDNIRLYDLLHLVWNAYLVSTLRGIYLTNINSKREFLIFRKALGGNPPTVFFPSAPESIEETGNIDFYDKYVTFSGLSIDQKKLKP